MTSHAIQKCTLILKTYQSQKITNRSGSPHGHAESTFKAIEQFANSQNIKRICLHVFRHNKAAQALYQKLGFHVTGLNMLKGLPE